jgi:hypothetical protein
MLCDAFLLASPMGPGLLPSVFKSLELYLRALGIQPDQAAAGAWSLSIVSTMVTQHPLYERDAASFMRMYLAERTDLPAELMLHVVRFLGDECTFRTGMINFLCEK